MNRIYCMTLLTLLLSAGCKEHKKEEGEEERRIYQIESVDENSGLQRMQVSIVNQDFMCGKQKYRLSVNRSPGDELPHVKSEMGLFADNRIQVKITRENGTEYFSKTFTKTDFASHLPESYLKRSILEGLVFDDVKTAAREEITLAASVSYPMTDLYIPFTIVVGDGGKYSICKDEDMGELTPLEQMVNR